jgi:hypothetical protein
MALWWAPAGQVLRHEPSACGSGEVLVSIPSRQGWTLEGLAKQRAAHPLGGTKGMSKMDTGCKKQQVSCGGSLHASMCHGCTHLTLQHSTVNGDKVPTSALVGQRRAHAVAQRANLRTPVSQVMREGLTLLAARQLLQHLGKVTAAG